MADPPASKRSTGLKVLRIVESSSRQESKGMSSPTREPTVPAVERTDLGTETPVMPPGQKGPGNAITASMTPADLSSLPSAEDTGTDSHSAYSSGNSENDEHIKLAFDVYATPFVPEALRMINHLPGIMHQTPPRRDILFATHATLSFPSGLKLTLHHPPTVYPPIPGLGFNPGTLTISSYEAYFGAHLREEMESQRRKVEIHSLYNQRISIRLHQFDKGFATFSFSVPGLREDTPLVEEDDLVDFRQLVHGAPGMLHGTNEYLAAVRPRREDYGRLINVPGWTGDIYQGRVTAVTKSVETLTVQVLRFPATNFRRDYYFDSRTQVNLYFNVRFHVPESRHAPMHLALAAAQRTLANSAQTIGQGDGHQQSTWLRSMLFPTEADSNLQTKLHPGAFRQHFFDDQLNWEQKKAVQAICKQNYGTLPYLVSGPPGTGKTKTVIEMALQLIHDDKGVSRVLLCAPSETAADTLAIRLRDYFVPNQLLRLNRPTRTFAEVPSLILHFCHVKDDAFSLPPLEQLLAYRVVVTSCRDASLLLQARVTNADMYDLQRNITKVLHPLEEMVAPRLHWTALLIDEAAQAMEPEALIPITVVAPPGTPETEPAPILVMVGDEHQLSPRTSLPSSPLKESLFARLFRRPVYAEHPLSRGKTGEPPPVLRPSMLPIPRPAFTNLFRNYRSHPAILAIPSALFYHDTLEPEARGTDRLSNLALWRGRGWPVLFHHNSGNDELERDGGGWHNPSEAHLALRYASALSSSGLVRDAEICVMSPFKAQVVRLRAGFRAAGLWEVSVGPTEAFQGIEFDVVVLCTTRARGRFLEKDREVGWGVVGMENAMNVALTRARYGLVVVGRRELLGREPSWRAFLEFCERNGLVEGEGGGDGWKAPEVTDARGRPRLERVMLAQEAELDGPVGSGALGGVDATDEMWVNELHGVLGSDESGSEAGSASEVEGGYDADGDGWG